LLGRTSRGVERLLKSGMMRRMGKGLLGQPAGMPAAPARLR
jgi:hypothetical protein